jgi:hypothetical protein
MCGVALELPADRRMKMGLGHLDVRIVDEAGE